VAEWLMPLTSDHKPDTIDMGLHPVT